ncbi:MAG: hypothetical protein ABIW38_11740 [Ferruginibacter sp.]
MFFDVRRFSSEDMQFALTDLWLVSSHPELNGLSINLPLPPDEPGVVDEFL